MATEGTIEFHQERAKNDPEFRAVVDRHRAKFSRQLSAGEDLKIDAAIEDQATAIKLAAIEAFVEAGLEVLEQR